MPELDAPPPLPDPELQIRSRGVALDTNPHAFGFLHEFDRDPVTHLDEARNAYTRDGYLHVKRFWPREEILRIRSAITTRMALRGFLDPDFDPLEAIPNPSVFANDTDQSKGSATIDGLLDEVPEIEEVLFDGRLITFFEHFLGGEILSFDQIWFRAMPHGFGTVPHCDLVYMGRGTHNLFTVWTPWGDIDLRTGGLMILEDSLDHEETLRPYLERDVDDYCSNKPLPDHLDLESTTDNKVWGGWLSKNPVTLREKLGGRWLTSPRYEMGDLLLFSMKLVHGSLDNQSRHLRLSTDTRYQLASEPADQRWTGEGPRGHVGFHKRAKVC